MADEVGRRNVRDLRRANRALLLRRLYFHGPLSRQDLILGTGLSAASVSNVVADLLEAGLVEEAGAVDSEGGRPRILLRVNADRYHVIGVDVGETGVQVERFDLDLREQRRATVPLPAGHYEPERVVRAIADGIAQVTSGDETGGDGTGADATDGDAIGGDGTGGAIGGQLTGAGSGREAAGGSGGRDRPGALGGPELLGVGIGVPGIVQRTPEAVVHGQTIGWDAVPLEALLRCYLDVPLFIDNGAVTMGQAETWFGAGRDAESALFLLIGSGVGACVITGGAPYQGATTSAGEWGHTTAVIGGRSCRCGARGCLEAYISAESVVARYREAPGAAPLDDADEESALRTVVALATGPAERDGAAAARDVLDETATYLGVGIGNLINLFQPQRVIIGGWAGLLMAPHLLGDIRATAAQHSLRQPYRAAAIELSGLGRDAVALGAATLPVSRFLATGGEAPAGPPARDAEGTRAGSGGRGSRAAAGGALAGGGRGSTRAAAGGGRARDAGRRRDGGG